MKKFILLYNGPATPMDQMTEEQGKEAMEGWDKWMTKVGSDILDMGQPMDADSAKVVMDDGSEGTPTKLNGYTVIQAADMDEALKLVEDHPFLSEGKGKFGVEVFELQPIPEMS